MLLSKSSEVLELVTWFHDTNPEAATFSALLGLLYLILSSSIPGTQEISHEAIEGQKIPRISFCSSDLDGTGGVQKGLGRRQENVDIFRISLNGLF